MGNLQIHARYCCKLWQSVWQISTPWHSLWEVSLQNSPVLHHFPEHFWALCCVMNSVFITVWLSWNLRWVLTQWRMILALNSLQCLYFKLSLANCLACFHLTSRLLPFCYTCCARWERRNVQELCVLSHQQYADWADFQLYNYNYRTIIEATMVPGKPRTLRNGRKVSQFQRNTRVLAEIFLWLQTGLAKVQMIKWH